MPIWFPFKKPTRFYGSNHLSQIPPILCDGISCQNLGQGRRHIHPLGGPKGKATKTLTYHMPAEIVKIATGLIFPSQPTPPAKAGKKVRFSLPPHIFTDTHHPQASLPPSSTPQPPLRSAVKGARTCTPMSTSSTMVGPSVTEGQVVDPEIDPPFDSKWGFTREHPHKSRPTHKRRTSNEALSKRSKSTGNRRKGTLHHQEEGEKRQLESTNNGTRDPPNPSRCVFHRCGVDKKAS